LLAEKKGSGQKGWGREGDFRSTVLHHRKRQTDRDHLLIFRGIIQYISGMSPPAVEVVWFGTVVQLSSGKEGNFFLYALIKKKIKFSSYIRKFRIKQLQSYMKKGFLIYEEMRKYLTIYEEAVSHRCLCNCSILNFLIYTVYEENFIFFLSVCPHYEYFLATASFTI
jgi:hypothetical protein